MCTGRRSPVYFHAEHRMIPWLREIDPFPIVEIHPQVADSIGVNDGEWIYIENDRGRIKRKAKVTPTIHPKVIMVPHGWWLPEEKGSAPEFYGIWDLNVNNLIPVGTQSKSGYGGGAYKTILCRVAKIKGGDK